MLPIGVALFIIEMLKLPFLILTKNNSYRNYKKIYFSRRICQIYS